MYQIRQLINEAEKINTQQVLTALREKESKTVEWAQSAGIPPALINTYAQVAKQITTDSDPKALSVFQDVEKQLADFITGASKTKISRRQLFTGAVNFVALISNLKTVLKLLQQAAPPKISKPSPKFSRPIWVTLGKDDLSAVFEKYGNNEISTMMYSDKGFDVVEEFENLIASEFEFGLSEPQVNKETAIQTLNDWLFQRKIGIQVVDVDSRYAKEKFAYIPREIGAPEKIKSQNVFLAINALYDDEENVYSAPIHVFEKIGEFLNAAHKQYNIGDDNFDDEAIDRAIAGIKNSKVNRITNTLVAEWPELTNEWKTAIEDIKNGNSERFGGDDVVAAFGMTSKEALGALHHDDFMDPDEDDEDWDF